MPRPAKPRPKPHGRDQAMAELLAAARTLFAERGFDAVSVRDISEVANVNHSLLHRHFGTKENLLHEVISAEAAAFTQAVGPIDDPADALRRLFAANAEDLTFARILSYATLSNGRPSGVLVADGVLGRIADSLIAQRRVPRATKKSAAASAARARETTAVVGALVLGWLLFEPFLAGATGIDPDHLSGTRKRVDELIGQIVREDLTQA